MNDSFERESSIVTPEHVQLRFSTAGLGSRAGAHLLDILIIAAALVLVYALLSLLLSLFGVQITDWTTEYAIAFYLLFVFAWIAGYFIISEYYYSGQTIGKRVMGLKVIQMNGQSLTFLSSTIRNVMRLIDFLPFSYVLGVVWMFFHPQDKRLGDLAAGTIVVRDNRAAQRRIRRKVHKWIEKKLKPTSSYEWPDEAIARLDREDWELVASFAEKLPTLLPGKRDEFARQIANRVGPKLHPEESVYTSQPVVYLALLYERMADDHIL